MLQIYRSVEELDFSVHLYGLLLNFIECVSLCFFKPSRGLRQEDPLSPFLFVIIMEVLTRLLKKEEDANELHGIRVVRNAPPITHLSFVDNIMLFCRANGGEVMKMNNCFLKFNHWSSKMTNHKKSFLHFSRNMSQVDKDRIASILRLNDGTTGSNYLGLSLCIPHSRSQACKALKDKVYTRVTGWKAKTLSSTGITILIQTVAAAMTIYFMAVYSLPKEVIRCIDVRFKNFWWGI